MNNLGKKPGKYITISFDDMTDHNNYQHVLGIFIKELRKMISWLNNAYNPVDADKYRSL